MRSGSRLGLLTIAAICAVFSFSQESTAAVIAFDDFESYTAGTNLNAGSGGTGWTNNWVTVGAHTTVQSKQLDDPNGNVDGGLQAAGLQPTSSLGDTSAFIQRGIPVTTGTVYMSMLIRKEVMDSGDFLGFAVSDGATGNSSATLSVGLKNATDNPFFARVGQSANTDTTTFICASNTDHLVVAKFSKDGSANYNRTDLFIDPVDQNEPGVPDATVNAVDTGLLQLSLFSVRNFQPEAGDTVFIDELRFADTFAESVPPSVPDTNAPIVSLLSPVDDATDVDPGADLVVIFDENIALTNGGTITIKDLDTPTNLVITIPDPQITVAGDTLTINPASDLSFATAYALQISTNALADISTNFFAGITNDTTWNFSTAAREAAAGYDFFTYANLDADGDDRWEDLTAGNPSGLELLLDDSPAVSRIPVSSGTRITHAYDFPGGSTNNEAGALLVSAGTTNSASFQSGTIDWTSNSVTLEIWFRPDNLTPTPTNGQVIFEDGGGSGLGVFIDDNNLKVSLDASEGVITYDLLNDPSGLLPAAATSEFIHVVVTLDVVDINSSIDELYINAVSVGTGADADGDWSGGDAAGFGTRGGNNVGGYGNGQMDTESFDGQVALIRVYHDQVLTAQEVTNNFKTVNDPDITPPAITATVPLDNATEIYVANDMVVTFDENILLNSGGTVTIKDLDTPSNIVITVPDAQLSVLGSTLTINPSGNLSFSTNYAIQISATAVSDVYTNYFAGIADDTTWNFSTAAEDTTPPVITGTTPADNATNVAPVGDLVVVFDDDIIAGVGNIVITNLTSSSHVTSIDITDGTQISISSNVLSITPTVGLPGGDEVAILIDSGAVRNLATLGFAGIGDTTTWNFTLRGPTAVTWDGSGDMNWTEPDSTSWSGGSYLSGDTAQFLGAGPGAVTIDAGGVTPSGVVVNSSSDYTFSGGSIGGSGSLTKSGSGIATFSSSNAFSGDVSISGGELLFSTLDSWGGSGKNVTFTGSGTLSCGFEGYGGGQLSVSAGKTAFITATRTISFASATGPGQISYGNGSKNKILTLTDASGFTGNILNYCTYSGGMTVQFKSLGESAGGGHLQFGGAGSSDNNQQGTFRLYGNVGPLTMNNRQVQILNPTSKNAFRYNRLENNNSSAVNKWVINTDLTNAVSGKNIELWLQGNNAGDNEFAGSIPDGPAGKKTILFKGGNGKWILSGTNTFSGGATLTAGMLVGAGVDSLGKGKVTVNAGTLVLQGSACLSDAGILNITGGNVQIDDREIVGTLQFGGTNQLSGTWGATGNGKADYTDAYFTGTELLYVGIDFPPSGTVLIVR